jgi:hypothetical protein
MPRDLESKNTMMFSTSCLYIGIQQEEEKESDKTNE